MMPTTTTMKMKNEATSKGPKPVPPDGGVIFENDDGVQSGEKGVADTAWHPATLDGDLASQLLKCRVRS